MTRWALLIKWLTYTAALLPVWFLEAVLLRRTPVFGVFPVLLPLAAVAVAVLEGAAAGAGFGMAVGVLCDVVYFGTNGVMTLALTLLGAGVGLVTQYGLRQNYWGFLLCSAGALTVLDAGRVFRRLLVGMAPLPALLRIAVPEVLWSLVFTLPVYLLFRAIHRRVGGTTLM